MTDRQGDVFFYGLFMDVDLLRENGVVPKNPRRGFAPNFALCIGQRATLVPSEGARLRHDFRGDTPRLGHLVFGPEPPGLSTGSDLDRNFGCDHRAGALLQPDRTAPAP